MASLVDLQRRNLLKYAAIGIAGTVTFPAWSQAIEFKRVNQASAGFYPDVEIELTQNVADIAIFEGEKTRVWKVTGKVLKGSSEVIDAQNNTAVSWYNPDPAKSDEIFKKMINDNLAGENSQTSIENAAASITTLLKQIQQ